MTDKKEQEMKEEINNFMRRKDFYQVLGIQKTATDSQIKKAYRTLALRFHPDKNQTQGAKEVFKKVSNSYATLIDPQKRKRYDQFGAEEDRPRPQYHHHHHHHGQDQQFYQFDDIFQAFFGGVPRQHRGQRHFRAYQFNNFNRPQQNQQQGGFNIYYIFIIFFLIYTILPLFQSSPNFSLSPNFQHRIRRTTSKLNVEYFVNQKFLEQARNNRQYLKKAQMQMDKEYLLQLQQKCETMKNQKRNLQIYAYSYSSEGRQRQNYLNRAKNVDMTSCRYLHQISTNFEDYVRELTYMKF